MNDDYAQKIQKRISDLKLDKYFIFESFVQPQQAISLSDITVLPSLEEGFAIASIESFIMKKLHIRTKTAGYSDMADACVGVDIADSKQLQIAIEQWLDGKDFTKLIEYAYNVAINKFTVDAMVESLLGIYKSVINNK